MARTASLATRLDRLESAEAIRDLVGRYALGADRRNDPAIFRDLFTEDAVWEAEGFGRHEGRDVILDAISTIAREQIVWTLHFMTSPIIEIDPTGETARCRWWLWETSKITATPGAEAVAHWLGGTYDSRLRREAGAWRFSHVTLSLSLISPHADGFTTV